MIDNLNTPMILAIDVEAAMIAHPHMRSRLVVEIGLHKARYEHHEATEAQKTESREWLVARGYSRMFGVSWDNHD